MNEFLERLLAPTPPPPVPCPRCSKPAPGPKCEHCHAATNRTYVKNSRGKRND